MKGPWERSEEAPPFSRPLPPPLERAGVGGKGGFSEPENLVGSRKEDLLFLSFLKSKRKNCLSFPQDRAAKRPPPKPGGCGSGQGQQKRPRGGALVGLLGTERQFSFCFFAAYKPTAKAKSAIPKTPSHTLFIPASFHHRKAYSQKQRDASNKNAVPNAFKDAHANADNSQVEEKIRYTTQQRFKVHAVSFFPLYPVSRRPSIRCGRVCSGLGRRLGGYLAPPLATFFASIVKEPGMFPRWQGQIHLF